jgi:hypothetical protein
MNKQQYLSLIIGDCTTIKDINETVRNNISNIDSDNYLLLFKKAMSKALDLAIVEVSD